MPLISQLVYVCWKLYCVLMYAFYTAFRNKLKLMFCSFLILHLYEKGNLLTAWSFASTSPFLYSGFKAFMIYLYLCIKFAYVIHKHIVQLLSLLPLIRAILHVLSVMVLRIKYIAVSSTWPFVSTVHIVVSNVWYTL